MATKFSRSIKIMYSILLFYAIHIKQYHMYICKSVLNHIFDTAKNAYCILSDQYTDNSIFCGGSESWYRPRRDWKLRF